MNGRLKLSSLQASRVTSTDTEYHSAAESSAQGAARQASYPYPSLSAIPGIEERERLAGTFGRSSQSSVSPLQSTRRKTSPTQRSAFRYLGAECLNPKPDQQQDIKQYIHDEKRQERIIDEQPDGPRDRRGSRTLTPEQIRQQQQLADLQEQEQELTRTRGQRSISSPETMLDVKRTSHNSTNTVSSSPMVGFASSISGSDPRYSRLLPMLGEAIVLPYDSRHVSGAGGFESTVRDSPRRLPLAPGVQGDLSHSASVSVRTPMWGHPPEGLPAGQRASFLDSEDPNLINPQSRSSRSNVGHQRRMSAMSRPAQSTSRRRAASMPATRSQSSEYLAPGESWSNFMVSQQRAKERFHLSQIYSGRPRFPSPPYSELRSLQERSRLARLHQLTLPMINYLYIPATLFLDYNVIFALVQVAAHPDSTQSGVRTAWWVATGIYAGCTLLWLFGVVVLYECFWQYSRRWSVERPYVLPIYLSAPASAITSFKSFTLYSLLRKARFSANRRDFMIESFWLYSQNWPTVLTLLPRAVISVILLVLYRPSSPGAPTIGERDSSYFVAGTGRLTTYAFVVLIINASWVAWNFVILLSSWLGLVLTLGWRSIFEKEKGGYNFFRLEMHEAEDGSRRYLFGPTDHKVEEMAKWAWKKRAEDRIRAVLFDAGANGDADTSDCFVDEPLPGEDSGPQQYLKAGDIATLEMEERGRYDSDAFGATLTLEQAQAFPTTPGDTFEVEKDQQSDPYSPAPELIGRSPRSKERIRGSRSVSFNMLVRSVLAQNHLTPVSALQIPEPSPDKPSPTDSPILSGRIVSTISSDLPSTEVAPSLGEPFSPVQRDHRRPRSPPSDHGEDFKTADTEIHVEIPSHLMTKDHSPPAPASDTKHGSIFSFAGFTLPRISSPGETKNSSLTSLASSLMGKGNGSKPNLVAEEGEERQGFWFSLLGFKKPEGTIVASPVEERPPSSTLAPPPADERRGSTDSTSTDDSEEGRLWASFPDQSRIHPPGLIALNIERQRANTTQATGNEFAQSPSEGGLHAIREESWNSSLECPETRNETPSTGTREEVIEEEGEEEARPR